MKFSAIHWGPRHLWGSTGSYWPPQPTSLKNPKHYPTPLFIQPCQYTNTKDNPRISKRVSLHLTLLPNLLQRVDQKICVCWRDQTGGQNESVRPDLTRINVFLKKKEKNRLKEEDEGDTRWSGAEQGTGLRAGVWDKEQQQQWWEDSRSTGQLFSWTVAEEQVTGIGWKQIGRKIKNLSIFKREPNGLN